MKQLTPFRKSLSSIPFRSTIGQSPFLQYPNPNDSGEISDIEIAGSARPLGCYIAGNPGFGKSSLIQNMILDDINANRGVSVIDPTGDLLKPIIQRIPESRIQDVIYFSPAHPRPLNIFSYRDNSERRVLHDELVASFNLDNAPKAKPLLRKIIGTLFDANDAKPGIATFADIETFISNKKWREEKIWQAAPHREPQWRPWPSPGDFETISGRLTNFIEDPVLRQIISHAGGIDIWDVMQKNQILLVDLEDTETDLFIGALFVAKFQQATFRRRIVREADRVPYHLYIDEFNTILKFSVEHFEKILTRARKYKLCLTLANVLPSDLAEPVRKKLGTFGTLILFNLDAQDAIPFRHKILPIDYESLGFLAKFHATVRTDARVYADVHTPSFLLVNEASYVRMLQKLIVPANPSTSSTESGYSKDEEPGSTAGEQREIPSHRNKAEGPQGTR